MGQLRGLVAEAHQVGAVPTPLGVGLLVVVEQARVGRAKRWLCRTVPGRSSESYRTGT